MKLRVNKLAVGVGAVTGFISSYVYTKFNGEKIAYASWTTNYEPNPAAKWDYNWDHMEPKYMVNPKKLKSASGDNEINESLEKNTSKVLRHVILIRHGQYNTLGLTDNERVLTETGRKQAELTGIRLKELGIPFTEMVKSTMSRAQETGSLISKNLPNIPVTNCDFIREGIPIPPEPAIGNWRSEMKQFYQDGARIEAAFRKYFHRADPSQEKDSYTLLVCHANVIRYFVCRALQFPAEAWLRMSLNHGSITWITITPSGRVYLKVLGESGHFPPSLVTSYP
ncbi:serine/threonine-protein phosphatase Pgam5, mitochondrial-like isoform X1 [Harmonia axyridis]|uniref:serine/threonine-protein phosphatase Pgam5, mitochondrial-like isoform X1 n=1 Tax=Harmonia axyridis TaxID=115357 RepID=UPI001E2759B6|nr:serine/threonine-protein phosphatase Pgam5, mitochondrial-like isoform X1 [Harmonia axyridis]